MQYIHLFEVKLSDFNCFHNLCAGATLQHLFLNFYKTKKPISTQIESSLDENI